MEAFNSTNIGFIFIADYKLAYERVFVLRGFIVEGPASNIMSISIQSNNHDKNFDMIIKIIDDVTIPSFHLL